jgi:hypothetical protein
MSSYFQNQRRRFTAVATDEAGDPITGASLVLVIGPAGSGSNVAMSETATPGTYEAYTTLTIPGVIHYRVQEGSYVLAQGKFLVLEARP